MRATYSIATSAAAAYGVAASRTLLAVKGGAAFGVELLEWSVSFDGTSAAGIPCLVELCYLTAAGAGTPVAVTPVQTGGRTIAHGATVGQNYSAEPTTLTVIKSMLLTPNGGTWAEQLPPDARPDSAINEGFAIRLSTPAAVNARGTLDWARI